VNGATWEYLATGSGSQTILFLHGLTGAYDIWWQQIAALQNEFRIISVTYPAVNTLAELESGVLAILDHEGVAAFHVVGSSLGGYLAQYLVAHHPRRIQRAVFSNTFSPPTNHYRNKYGLPANLIPFAPQWLVMSVLKGSFRLSMYPASGKDKFLLAFLNEMASGRMSKEQVYGRYRCVVAQFALPAATPVPAMIVQASNDPLVPSKLRAKLRAAYPTAQVVTVNNGHFPYLVTPEDYTQTLVSFFSRGQSRGIKI